MRFKSLLQAQVVKYGFVGLLGTALHFGLLILLVEAAGMKPVPASAAGFVAVLIVSYYLNRNWTFRERADGTGWKSFAKYTVVSLTGLLLNTFVMYASVDLLKLPYVVGQAFVTFCVPVSNYILNRYWTFSRPRPLPEFKP